MKKIVKKEAKSIKKGETGTKDKTFDIALCALDGIIKKGEGFSEFSVSISGKEMSISVSYKKDDERNTKSPEIDVKDREKAVENKIWAKQQQLLTDPDAYFEDLQPIAK